MCADGKCVAILRQTVAHCSYACCLFVQFNCSLFSFVRTNFLTPLTTSHAIVRNTGKLYGGKLNVSHMGIYRSDEEFLNISFKEATIIRRLNVRGIRIRTMFVVSIYTCPCKHTDTQTYNIHAQCTAHIAHTINEKERNTTSFFPYPHFIQNNKKHRQLESQFAIRDNFVFCTSFIIVGHVFCLSFSLNVQFFPSTGNKSFQ